MYKDVKPSLYLLRLYNLTKCCLDWDLIAGTLEATSSSDPRWLYVATWNDQSAVHSRALRGNVVIQLLEYFSFK